MHLQKEENKRAILISRAIVVVKNNILVCESPDKTYFYLPGGHVEFCESVKDALLREIEEETREEGIISEYLGYIECNFIYNNKEIFELGHYFKAEIPKITFPQNPLAFEEGLTFKWLPIADIESSNLKPDILRTKIPELVQKDQNEIWHVSQNEIKPHKSV